MAMLIEIKNKKFLWILLPGLLIVYLSRLFFTLSMLLDLIILFYGVMFTAGGLLFILFSKLKLKYKLTSIVIVVLNVVIYYLAMPILLNASFQIYLFQNIDNLEKSNEILLTSSESVSIDASNDEYLPMYGDLNPERVEKVRGILNQVGANNVWIEDNIIYYELYGFLDNRYGIVYYIDDKYAPETKLEFKYIRGNWYIHFFGDEL